MWVPEPEYHFTAFKPKDREMINACMVALLIKVYDGKQGVSRISLGGGDFMLEKGFENYDINFENILKRMKLIAARSLVEMELEDYINVLKQELSGKIKDDYKMKIIGEKLTRPLELHEIEEGIKLGLELREKNKMKEKVV